MDRDGVGRRDLIQFSIVVDNNTVVESNGNFALYEINGFDLPDVAIENLLSQRSLSSTQSETSKCFAQ